MPGINYTSSQIDANLTYLSNQLRQIMERIQDQVLQINNMGQDGLETAGYSEADATTVLLLISYMYSIVQIYYGELQQGGTGGTEAIEFDFNNALSILWGGQVQ